MTCWSCESIAMCFNSNNYSSTLKNKNHESTAAVSLEVAAKDSTAVYFLNDKQRSVYTGTEY